MCRKDKRGGGGCVCVEGGGRKGRGEVEREREKKCLRFTPHKARRCAGCLGGIPRLRDEGADEGTSDGERSP